MSELGHLPALQATTALTPTVLIDPDEARAKTLATKFSVPHYSDRLADAAKYADAACVVVPHHVHTSVTCDLISDGLHILIEKPLAVTLSQCDQILEAADRKKVVLAVAMVRRFARTTIFLKQLLSEKSCGAARSFKLVSGTSGTWPTRSAYLLNVEQSGGGVLMSNGVHDIDLLSWLFGQPSELECFADADFGKASRLESDVLIKMTTEAGVAGEIELSRTRDLKSGLWIELERASIFSPLFGDELTITLPGSGPMRLTGHLTDDRAPGLKSQTFNDMLTDQLDDFAAAVRGEKAPMVSGLEGRKAIETIAYCYDDVRPLDLPWRQRVNVAEAV